MRLTSDPIALSPTPAGVNVDVAQLTRLRETLEGRYTIERELGRGGMSIVFLARDIAHDRPVALKVLRPELAASLPGARFLREIEIEARLQHPNILPMYDSGSADGTLYYIMPYVEGESLRERLRREGPLPLSEAISIASDVASALDYAHAHGVVHRDVKPGNILLSGSRAIVADFGIARAMTVVAGEELTDSGLALGTPEYMSPEQGTGERRLDGRSDVYSLGCVVHEMIAGAPPFTGPTMQAVIARHCQERPPSLRVVRPTVTRSLERAVETALAKVPVDRFATAAAFVVALQRPESRVDAAVGWLRAHRTLTIGAAFAVVTGSAAALRVVVPRTDALDPNRVVVFPLRDPSAPATMPTAGEEVRADPRRVAVLYFDTEVESPKLQLVANGLTQDLIDQLSQVAALHVVSANGVRPYRDRSVSFDSLVAALSVGTIVAGTLGGSADRPWLVVRLIDAVTGQQLDSKRLQPASGNILALRSALIEDVTQFLRARLGKEIRGKELRAGARSQQAWLLVRRVEHVRRDAATLYWAGDTVAAHNALDAADSLLRVAERLDPEWVDPIVLEGWIAAARIELAEGRTAAAVQRWAPQGLVHAERALARRPQYPPALELRGYLRFVAWEYARRPDPREFQTAERDLRAAAVAENPTQARAWSTLSALLQVKGSFAAAKLAAQRAYETDAFLEAAPAVLFRLHLTSLMLRQRREATDWCARGYARFPNNWLFTFCRLFLLYTPSDHPPNPRVARLLVEELERVTSPSERPVLAPRWRMLVAGVLARAGQEDSARRTLDLAKTSATDDREMDYYEAGVRVLLREHERALDLLERYVAFSPQMRPYLRGDPVFEPLYASARFQSLMAEDTTW
jgi:TolB-like protein